MFINPNSLYIVPTFSHLIFVSFEGYRRAPLEIASNTARLKSALHPGLGDDPRVIGPADGGLLQPAVEPLLQHRQVQEEVAAGAHRRAPAADLAARLLQLDGVDELAAAVALIATRVLETDK